MTAGFPVSRTSPVSEGGKPAVTDRRYKLIIPAVGRSAHQLTSAAFCNEVPQKAVLHSAVSVDRTMRIENSEYDWSAVTRVHDARKRADTAVGAGQRAGLCDDRASVVDGR